MPTRGLRPIRYAITTTVTLGVALTSPAAPGHEFAPASIRTQHGPAQPAPVAHSAIASTEGAGRASEPAAPGLQAAVLVAVAGAKSSDGLTLAAFRDSKAVAAPAPGSEPPARGFGAQPIALDAPGSLFAVIVFALMLLRRRMR